MITLDELVEKVYKLEEFVSQYKKLQNDKDRLTILFEDMNDDEYEKAKFRQADNKQLMLVVQQRESVVPNEITLDVSNLTKAGIRLSLEQRLDDMSATMNSILDVVKKFPVIHHVYKGSIYKDMETDYPRILSICSCGREFDYNSKEQVAIFNKHCEEMNK